MNRFRAQRQFIQAIGLVGLLISTVAAAPYVAPAPVPAPVPSPVQAPEPCPAASESAADVEVTGQVLYGTANGAKSAATVDIVQVYSNNPAYMRLKQFGLSETQGRGKDLFQEARASTNKALAAIARRHGIDVIPVPGGVTSAGTVSDHTREVIDQLPIFSMEGTLIHGNNPRAIQSVGELDSQAVLESIPAYLEWKTLGANDAQYHLLQKSYLDQFSKAVKKVARDQGLDGIAEKGNVTSRLGNVPDVTRAVVEALAG